MQAAPNTIVPQSALPVPIKSGSMKDCKLWYFVGAGLTGDEMSQKAGVSKEDLMKWNPILQRNDGGWNEMGLMAEYFYCVGV
jgi:hypothetical protein